MSEENCLFCKIVNGEIPGEFVHQDDSCVVIRDINPQAPTHVLVVPRDHVESLQDICESDVLVSNKARDTEVPLNASQPSWHADAKLNIRRSDTP